jgi:hypothetical protein
MFKLEGFFGSTAVDSPNADHLAGQISIGDMLRRLDGWSMPHSAPQKPWPLPTRGSSSSITQSRSAAGWRHERVSVEA